MLIEFRVENHRSIRDEQALTMEAGRLEGVEDNRPRTVAGHATMLLPVVALYGANGSGKSNVLSALGFMHHAVLVSHRLWAPDEGVPRTAFAWQDGPNLLSLFEVTLLLDDVRYQYGFVANNERFLEEWLHAWPHGRKQNWFERDGQTFKFGSSLRGENRVIEGVTRPNALYLAAAAQLGHAQLAPLFAWFSANEAVNVKIPAINVGNPNSERWKIKLPELEREPSWHGSSLPPLGPLRELLRSADVGILDIEYRESDSASFAGLRSQVWVKHASKDRDSWLRLDQESSGTQTLFELGPKLVEALATGSLLIVDELEASLHPLMARDIVRRFNDPKTNPKNAQLIFATHDTNLLGTTTGEPILRRDQIWLAEKDKEGATVIYPLTDFKPRKSENLERGYLQGRYGAIPFLGDLTAIKD